MKESEDLHGGFDHESFDRDLDVATKALGRKNIKEHLSALDYSRKIIPFYRRRSVLSIAASFLVLVCTISFWYSNANYSNSQLANTYYDEPNFSVQRGGSTPTNERAFSKYNDGAFDEVIDILVSEEGSQDGLLMLANAYFKSNQFDQARQTAGKLIAHPNTETRDQAEWLIIISKLSQDIAVDSELRRIIENESHSYNGQAKKLAKKISSAWRRLTF